MIGREGIGRVEVQKMERRGMMRSIVLSVILGVTAVAFASRHDGVVSGSGDGEPAGYVPVLVANGELAMTVDRTFGVRAELLEGQPVPAGFAMENAKDGSLVLCPAPDCER